MERKLASIRVIKDIAPIENADSIEVATVDGWHCVVKKGEFHVGEHVIYCEVDSVMPHTDPRFEWLRPRGFRIKTIKLRGQVSQGLLLPISYLNLGRGEVYYVGQDVTERLGIVKYEPPIPASLRGTVKGNFPTNLLSKSDEERVQNLQDLLTKYKGVKVSYTEKLDGSSLTCIYHDGEFRVCSRNLELLETEDNAYWKAARLENVEEKLKTVGKNIAVQGELIGFGVRGNKYALKTLEYWIFNVVDTDTRRYYSNTEVAEFCKIYNFKCVPYLGEFDLVDDIDTIIEMAKGNSKLNPKVNREGIVIRPVDPIQDPDFGWVSFKAINLNFLLKYDE